MTSTRTLPWALSARSCRSCRSGAVDDLQGNKLYSALDFTRTNDIIGYAADASGVSKAFVARLR